MGADWKGLYRWPRCRLVRGIGHTRRPFLEAIFPDGGARGNREAGLSDDSRPITALMSILIRRLGMLYEAEVTPPHGRGLEWRSVAPMSRDELVAALRDRGCHQSDIGDAFYEADPEWLLRE